jgi:hypothetical protein
LLSITADVSFAIPVCGDTTVEGDETFTVALETLDGRTLGCGHSLIFGPCTANVIVRNDDGPPTILMGNKVEVEPSVGSFTSAFPVFLSHPSENSTTVNFSTRNGTAQGAASCSPFRDYLSRSGKLTIPANTLLTGISVTICGNGIPSEPIETFFMDLSSPTNGTISDATGMMTILRRSDVGVFGLSPGEAQLQVDEMVTYTVDWRVPGGRVWRDLDSIDFRIRGGRTALWVRWEEAENTFKLCRKGGGGHENDRDEDENEGEDDQDFKGGPGLRCGPGATPGTTVVLETPLARLHLDGTSVVGSGPTGLSVTLRLSVSFKRKGAGHRYGVEVAATDDFGNRDDFFRLGSVSVRRR